ncbi:hypothetical protein ACFX2G_031393 [Malus domestica]
MIMKEDLTLADSFTLAEKHALWDEAGRAEKAQPRKESAVAQKKEDGKQSSSRHEAKCMDQPTTKEGPMTKN